MSDYCDKCGLLNRKCICEEAQLADDIFEIKEKLNLIIRLLKDLGKDPDEVL